MLLFCMGKLQIHVGCDSEGDNHVNLPREKIDAHQNMMKYKERDNNS